MQYFLLTLQKKERKKCINYWKKVKQQMNAFWY